MIQTEQQRLDDSFARLLADYDDHLAGGETPDGTAPNEATEELSQRLKAAQGFLKVLEGVWPRRTTAGQDGGAASPGPLHAVPRAIGRFAVKSVLGRGGAGIVYLARDPVLSREVAVKVPRLEMVLTPTLRQRFLREAQAAALLNHPNIIPTLEVGEADKLCFIVYSYCAGPTLAEWLARTTEPVPCQHAARLVEQLAEAMSHAHQRGILHRDLKPSNILLSGEGLGTKDDESQTEPPVSSLAPHTSPLITDFGLAKLVGDVDEVTRTGAVLGTPGYMAPEQTRSAKDLAAACDIWALGVILYELLTRRRPFVSSTPLEVMRQIQESEPAAPRGLRKDVPRDLETICLKCLAKEPGRRYASAFDLAADLRRFQEGQPVEARPVPWWERLGKWARRRPAGAALVAVLSLALLGAIVGTLFYIDRLEDLVAAADRENEAKQREAEGKLREAEAKLREGLLSKRAAKEEAMARRLGYAGDVRSAFQAIKEKNHLTAARMLARWPGDDADERGVEWYELNRQVHNIRPRNILLPSHELMKGEDANYQVFSRLAFAMSPDCRWAASMRDNAHLDIHDTADWKKVVTLSGPVDQAWHHQGIVFAPDGKTLAAAYNRRFPDGATHPAVTLWDWRKQKALANVDYLDLPEATGVMDLAFTAKGETLLVRVHQELRSHAVADFAKPSAGLTTSPVGVMTLSADGALLALANDKKLELRAFPSFTLLHELPWDSGRRPYLCFSRDGKQLVFGDMKQAHIIETSHPIPKLVDTWPVDSATALTFSHDGKWLFVGTEHGHLGLYDGKTGIELYREFGPSITHLMAHPDGQRLFVRTPLGGVGVTTAHWLPEPESIDTKAGRVYALAYSPGGSLLASAGQGLGVRIWDAASNKQVANLLCFSELFSVAFSPDGKTLVAGGIEGLIHRWDTASWKPLPPLEGHNDRVAGLAFTPDGKHLLSMSWDKTCRLWRLSRGESEHVFHAPIDHFSSLALSPHGGDFAWLGGTDPTLRIWNLERKEERELPFVKKPRAVSYSPDGRVLAAGDAGGDLHLFDARTGNRTHVIESHDRGIFALAYSPDGKVLASASLDKVVKIIDAASFLELATLHGPRDELRALTWSPDGKTLAAGGHDGHIWLWRAR